LLTRILTALPLIAGFLAALFLASAQVWLGIMALALFIAGMEWAGLARLSKLPGVAYGAFLAITGVSLALHGQDYRGPFLASLAFWMVAPWILMRGATMKSTPLLLGLGALVLLPTFLALIHLREMATNLLLAVVVLVVIADSAAYFTGRRFGRRKLAPSISPGKTWEGVMGAGVAVSILALALAAFWAHSLAAGVLVLLAAWALLALSIVGDLMESWLKRQVGLKDSGTLLPGHGGVLDRIDSLTATLPAAALFYSWMQ